MSTRPTYGEAHAVYRAAGWTGPLPLPGGKKWPPPEGWTGWAAPYPSYADSHAWTEECYPGTDRLIYGDTSQLALRMADDVIGLDVDHYNGKRGADTLAEAQRRWGPLPAAPRSSARGDGPSGIRFFSVPPGSTFRGKLAFPNLGLGAVEIIQYHHRYAVAWPSVNPDAGNASYLWYGTAGPDQPPHVERLNKLPAAWIEALRTTGEAGEVAADPATVQEFARSHSTGDQLGAIRGVLAVWERGAAAGSRHDAMLEAVCMAAREARAGRYPVGEVRPVLRNEFIRALAEARQGQRLVPPADARREFDSMWAWAVGQALALTVQECQARVGMRPPIPGAMPKLPTSSAAPAPPAPASRLKKGGAPASAGATSAADSATTVHAVVAPRPPLRAVPDDADPDDPEYDPEAAAEAWEQEQVEHELQRRRIKRLADDAERPPAPPIADGLLTFADLVNVKAPAMLVKRLVPESGVGFLNGRSGSYKSFLLCALAAGMATGRPVMGHDEFGVARPLKVLYVAAEGSSGVALRLRAYAHHHGMGVGDLSNLMVYPKAVNLSSEREVADLESVIVEHGIEHVMIDTFRQATLGVNESDNSELSVIIGRMIALRDSHGVGTTFADHTGHAGERAVGGEAKWTNSDYALMIKMPNSSRAADQQRTLTVEKLKDVDTTGAWDLRLVPVREVRDADGNPSAVVAVGSLEDAESGPFSLGERVWWTAELPSAMVGLLHGKSGRSAAMDIVRVLRLVDSPDGVTSTDLRGVVEEGPRGKVSKSTWQAGLALARRLDLISHVENSSTRFVLSDHWARQWDAEQGVPTDQ